MCEASGAAAARGVVEELAVVLVLLQNGNEDKGA